MQNNKIDLLEGSITRGLIRLALPIMATSFLQMAYNLIDIIWIGRIGSQAVAAVGTAGFFMWLSMALVIISKIGAEVLVAQEIGKKNIEEAKISARSAIQLVTIFAIFYAFIILAFNKYLIGFFNINDILVVSMARDYLRIIAIGILFAFLNPVFTAIYNGYGNSTTPFKINAVGLLINIILDPIFIFYFDLGVVGAALATIIGQVSVSIIFISKIKFGEDIFNEFNIFKSINFKKINKIIVLGLPASLRSGLFTIIAMIIARLIANWGPIPIAVQKIGSQIESLSWMTSEGFATATSTFIAQNYGAGKHNRIKEIYYKSISIMFSIGILVTIFFLVFPKFIFSLFISEKAVLNEGIIYLRILGISQLFMCIEITTSGAFNGLSKPIYPSIISIGFNLLRIPGAIILSSASILGLQGIWWAISLTSVMKGISAFLLFYYVINKTTILSKRLN